MKLRRSGILMHITSLPAEYGIGDFGPKAYQFADFLSQAKQGYWQILPLNPTVPAFGNSPYHSISAFACNPLLISPDLLIEDGLLDKSELEFKPNFPADKVDYASVLGFKYNLFLRAFQRFVPDAEFNKFCTLNSSWLDDYALFAAMKEKSGGKSWPEWDPVIRDRHPDVFESIQEELRPTIEKAKFLQYICDRQWRALKKYCNQRMIHIIGDIPIYVDYDSADVWSYPEIFKLDKDKKPYVVAGVPPDYFSSTGQLWGNP
ncbi:MAG: 4-alpha-glucanotransferase, partial [Candidatus Aminicenantes bacterium]|nr:4-alpha-glucanotransferase [Candidatus Aminicenantes bacterium]